MLLLPWQPGFWEIYHSNLPPNWTDALKDGTAYFAPDPTTGQMSVIQDPQEYYEREEEFLSWQQNSLIDPFKDPFEGWYPLCELDQADESSVDELDLVV